MGRNKIKIEKIVNSKIRQVTFYKRKRGLLKKAMELSLLCESKIFLCIVDKVEKLTIYSSENDINKFLGTYLQKISQNKIQKDILSNTDYNTLFTTTSKEEPHSKLDNYDHETERLNQCKNDYHPEGKANYLGGYDNFDEYINNEKPEEFNLYMNNQEFFDEDINTNSFKNNTFKSSSDEVSFPSDGPASPRNMNNIFTTVFTTDNNSTSSNNSLNSLNRPKTTITNMTKPAGGHINNKRSREEVLSNNKAPVKVLETSNLNQNINFAVINSQNLANLFPNLNMLSQNIGVVNWVVPMNSDAKH